MCNLVEMCVISTRFFDSIVMLTHHAVGIIVPVGILIGFCHSDQQIISQGAGTSGDQLQDLIGCEEGFHGVVGVN